MFKHIDVKKKNIKKCTKSISYNVYCLITNKHLNLQCILDECKYKIRIGNVVFTPWNQ